MACNFSQTIILVSFKFQSSILIYYFLVNKVQYTFQSDFFRIHLPPNLQLFGEPSVTVSRFSRGLFFCSLIRAFFYSNLQVFPSFWQMVCSSQLKLSDWVTATLYIRLEPVRSEISAEFIHPRHYLSMTINKQDENAFGMEKTNMVRILP